MTINTDGNKIFTTIDGIGRQLQILRELRIDHNGNNAIDTSNSENSDGLITTKTAYDDNSRVTSRKDDKDNTTSYAYDHRNRKITETRCSCLLITRPFHYFKSRWIINRGKSN
ncbi:MAG: hypothetical protein P1V97_28355 [Planctomycetota bacterium]|nr:hypothetical protein [Planctomycetota bacterium]